MSRKILLVFVLAMGVGGLMMSYFMPGGASYRGGEMFDSLVDDLLASGGEAKPLFEFVKDDWSTVCRIDPYENYPGNLPENLRKMFSEYDFRPSRWSLGENESGLVFLNAQTKIGKFFVINHSKIKVISGPRCLERSEAYFKVQEILALNAKYTQLTILKKI